MTDSDRSPPWWVRIWRPGSYTTTSGGVFLGLAAPLMAGLGVIILFLGDIWAGLAFLIIGGALTVLGHWLAGR